MRVAVVGGGWAGLAAAVEATRLGHRVHLFERAPALGGRARRVHWTVEGRRVPIDNGQHVLIGAYRDTLALMAAVGVDEAAVLQRLTLRIEYADGPAIRAPRWPAPLHLVAALLGARGLPWPVRLDALRFAAWARARRWRLPEDCTVDALLAARRADPRTVALLWAPLCVAALNTPSAQASAQVFLNVLRDSLGASRPASDLLVPRTDLSALLPDAAGAWLLRHGAQVSLRASVQQLLPAPPAGHGPGQWRLPGASAEAFDAVVLATAAHDAAALLARAADAVPTAPDAPALASTVSSLQGLDASAILTAWMLLPDGRHWDRPMWALRADRPDSPAQWLFARDRQPDGRRLASAIVSAHVGPRGQAGLAAGVLAQIGRELGRAARLPAVAVAPADAPIKLVLERQATFLCAPALRRPGHATGLAGVWLAGDYTDSPYPGTLETAVRSGLAAAGSLGASVGVPRAAAGGR